MASLLFTPLKIGPVTVRNRIVQPPMLTGMTDVPDGVGTSAIVSETYARFVAERARGGVGLIITGTMAVHPTSGYALFDLMPRAYDKRQIPVLQLTARMVQEHGAKLFCQLGSMGGFMKDGGLQSKLPSWGPSPVHHTILAPEMPKEMEIEEIEEMIEAFGKSAENCREGGVDGIELHGAHNALINQFLSPYYNRRTDEYGGSMENRCRFAVRVIERVKQVTGNDMALGIRLSGDDMMPGGLTIQDTKAIAQYLEATGKIDYVSISIAPMFLYLAPMYVPTGHLVPYAAEVKEVVNIPVFTAGRINDPAEAEKILDDGKADMICMGRALIADPEMPNKAREGKADDIMPCTGCTQNCYGKITVGTPIDCANNPTVGKEKEWGAGTLKPAETKKKVLVIGGGPGGLEAARIAAMRGHDVSLYEKASELGGQINLAAKLTGRAEMDGFVRTRIAQVKKLGVNVVLSQMVTADLVQQLNPDAVVVATGSTAIPVWDAEIVATPDQILIGEKEAGAKVIIQDEMFDITASALALHLASQGKQVEILTSVLGLGMATDGVTLVAVVSGLAQAKVKITPMTMIVGVQGKSVTAMNVFTQETSQIEDVDTVIPNMGRTPNEELYKQLKGKVKELHRIGDCVCQRPVDRAIYDGHKVGREL
ncbi:MAG: FAD-dependent oxidoreductase [Chloroflexi bacterium]|nr:FAD-dependent oxidoreductase [Chloroflexota bacterium]